MVVGEALGRCGGWRALHGSWKDVGLGALLTAERRTVGAEARGTSDAEVAGQVSSLW